MRRIFDVHVHYPEANFLNGDVDENKSKKALEQIAANFEKYNVVKACLLGGPKRINDLVLEACKDYNDLFVPMAYLDMDNYESDIVDELFQKGFKGFKIIATQKPYDSFDYFPFYEKAEKYGLVILFHTGILGGMEDYLNIVDPKKFSEDTIKLEKLFKMKKTTSNNMRAIYLDTLGMNFPELKVIGAHLGYGDYDIACAVARWRRNVYFDISGGDVVRRHIIERNYIGKEISVNKIIYGSDCSIDRISHEVEQWTQMLTYLNLSDDDIDKVLYKNAAYLFDMN